MNDEFSCVQRCRGKFRPAKRYVRAICGSERLREQFFNASLDKRRVSASLKDATNAPVAIQQHHAWNPSGSKLGADTTVSHEDIEGIPVALDEGGDFAIAGVFDGVEVDTQNAQLVGGEALVKRLHMGHRIAARPTKDGPKIEQHHFSALRRQIHGTTIPQQTE